MKKIFAIILAMVTLLAFSSVFAACSDGGDKISRVFVNDDKNIIVEYSDGRTQMIGSIEAEESEKPKTILRTYINIYSHLIVEYSDHTKEDLGLITPKKITVTFVDSEDNVISTVETYAGLTIEEPAAPEREDEIFVGWDKDLTDITSDVTVKAVYRTNKFFTVRFVDEDGTLLKEETVLTGNNATPPAVKEKAGYTFDGWIGDYEEVTSNRTIKALYRKQGVYFVTFNDYNGLTLKVDTVIENGTAVPPEDPERDGYIFIGWSVSYNKIRSDKKVVARYTFASEETENVFDIFYVVDGDTVYLTVYLDGDITLAGFGGTIAFDGMTLSEARKISPKATVDIQENGVAVNFSSDEKITGRTSILTATLKITGDNGKVNTEINCWDDKLSTVPCTVIGQDLRLK